MGKVLVNEMPIWMKETLASEYDEDFIKILDFYLFHAPVPGQSARCKLLKNMDGHLLGKNHFGLISNLNICLRIMNFCFRQRANSTWRTILKRRI